MTDSRKQEDEDLIRRITNEPARHVFKVSVRGGPQTAAEVDRYLTLFRRRFTGPFKGPRN